MNTPIKRGISFGLTSGIITTLGVMIGLNAGTGLKLAVIGGIITVAVSDAFSDALGMHMAEESNKKAKHKDVWEATIATFVTKLGIASTFIFPVILLDLSVAIILSVIWGLFLLIIFNYILAKQRNESPAKIVTGHLLIAIIVITLTYYLGILIKSYFG
jgi:vacuolar iron transporter family protein